MKLSLDNENKGFTLAEVLITLGIIGVVASMTISSVVSTFRKQQTVAMLKKAYTEINQALHMATVEHGPMDTWYFVDFESAYARASYFFDYYIGPHLSVLNYEMPSTSVCWHDKLYTLDGVENTRWKNGVSTGGRGCFTSVAGYTVHFWLHGTGNGAWFIVDINGLKRPNTLGRDIFPFIVTWGNKELTGNYKLGFFPYGLHLINVPSRDGLINGVGGAEGSDIEAVNCKFGTGKINAGGLCAALIMMDGWEIRDDYPWK